MNFAGWASYMAPIVTDDSNPKFAENLEQVFVSANPKNARQFAEVTFFADCRQQLSALQTPTLILQCSEDSIVPLPVGAYLNEHIVQSELVVMEAKGHYPHISQPQDTANIILNFIETRS